MMFRGCILRRGLVMIMGLGMIMRRVAGVHMACLMMRRHEIGQLAVVGQARRRCAPGKCRGRREDAEQIGEGNDPSRLHPY